MSAEHLTTTEAAAILGRTPRRLAQMAGRGEIAATKHGRDWLIPRAEVLRYRALGVRPGPRGRAAPAASSSGAP